MKEEKNITSQETAQEEDKNVRKPEGEEQQKDSAETEKEADEELSLVEVIKETAREDEQPASSHFTLRKILGGDILNARQVKSQIWLILLIVAFTLVYVANRYSCQKHQIEIDGLNAQLQKSKYKALSISSELTEMCRESNVLQLLKAYKDSTLKQASQPPYIINVNE